MKQNFFLATLVFLQCNFVSSQAFVNGSFEINTAPVVCNYNLGNTSFNSYVAGTQAYGPGNELDIIRAGCYNPGIPHGIRAIGVAASPSDEFSMLLTAPLVAGNSYTIGFTAYSETTFRAQGNVQIGGSTSSNNFGTLLYTAVTVPGVWTSYSFTFTASAEFTHITVRNQAGPIHWNFVDNFVIVVPLPVEMLSFSGRYEENDVLLDWSTASEVNNDYFSIERSTDALNFVEIGRVTGSGTSNILNNYVFVDPDPFIGINYYRLRQIDYNGEFKTLEMISVNVEQIETRVFPNPANGSVKIRVGNSGSVRISMINSVGQVVKNELLAGEHVDISELPNGIYFIYVYSDQQTTVTRLVKE